MDLKQVSRLVEEELVCDTIDLMEFSSQLGGMLSVDGDADAAVEASEYVRDEISLDNLSRLCLPITMSQLL